MKFLSRFSVLLALSFICAPLMARAAASEPPRRITILFDAFGAPSALQKDWGFAALVEYGGKRVLFDTGSRRAAFAHNLAALNVDLAQLDAVVISHRHDDHTAGLPVVLKANPTVKIYTPREGAFFKGDAPRGFFAQQPDQPANLRYYDGQPPDRFAPDTPWGEANFINVGPPVEILPGIFVFSTQSQKPGTMEMNEISLAIRTPQGLAVVVGCAHPGVEKILAEAAKIDPKLYSVFGGFHLVLTPVAEVERVAKVLDEDLKIARVAPGHCTSELGFAVFRRRFKERFDEAGLGAVVPLP